MAHLYKSRLQNYAQKKNIPLPTYTVETKGPPHCRHFKAQVTIDGNTYAGAGFSSTLKDAEHEAAKVAFMSLSQDEAQDDDCLYKSLLQELAQKKGLALPVYSTNRSGPPHMPCFVSTVEISGESYVGEDARTKKHSEMNAAKIAYIALTDGGPRAKNGTVISNTVGGPRPNNATVISNTVGGPSATNGTVISNTVGTSSSGSSSLQAVVAHKNEPTTSKGQTIINDRPYFTIPSDPEKAKGYLELKGLQDVIEKHKMTMEPIMIDQPQPLSAPTIVDFSDLNIKQINHVTQAGEGSGANGKLVDSGSAKPSPNVVDVPKPSTKLTNPAIQGPGSNGKKIQPFVKEAAYSPPLIDLDFAMPHSTKIVIRPHVQGMTYDGPILVSDEEWVAMKVKVDDGM